MDFNRATSPSTGYSIIDIRGNVSNKPSPSRPVSPPESSGSSEDAFNGSDLTDIILSSLSKPLNQKSIPTYVLYDKRGLQLFDQITYLDDEYYLTSAERDILLRKADELVQRLKEGSVIFELGAGALRKTQVILDAIEKHKVRVTYYALDLDQYELEKSLSSLGTYTYVKLYGLLGTYDQGIPWISKHFTTAKIQKSFLWLGSSIGNQKRGESAIFLSRIQRMCMEPGDYFVIGFDKRNDPAKISLAYNDTKGLTKEFILNGLDHVNRIVGKKDFMNRNLFAYDSRYQPNKGRHIAHYRALADMNIGYKTARKNYSINIKKDELIHVEHSYKYSLLEADHILRAAQLNRVDEWLDSKNQYRLIVAEIPPFTFHRNKDDVQNALVPSKNAVKEEKIACDMCNDDDHASTADEKDLIKTFSGSKSWSTQGIPSIVEWEELWKAWDLVTQHMLDWPKMLFERPISLRHPFIFYLGHIPGFLDIQLSRHQVDKELGPTRLTEPAVFADLFERGIDPDMDDPTQCHPHSEVPSQQKDWPSIDSILDYKKKIRDRLRRFLLFWETAPIEHPDRKRQARMVWMCFEHEAMHLETILYMLLQSSHTLPPLGVSMPSWKKSHAIPSLKPLSPARTLFVPAGSVTLGHNDSERLDHVKKGKMDSFGWDNENPERQTPVKSFRIETRPITNGEYYDYVIKNSITSLPASWIKDRESISVRTVFGSCPLEHAQHWPVQVSYEEAHAYAIHRKARIPTEPEWMKFRQSISSQMMEKEECKLPNIGFTHWTPTDVNNEQVHLLGDQWEWTETLFDSYKGFEKSLIYPGYSSDFFDKKHHVVLGGSWATHPRMAERQSFRNYYQSKYPYAFIGFRLCYSN